LNKIDLKPLVEKAKKFISTAELLLDHGDYDSSVSRTYYAMFHIVEAILLTKNLSFKSHRGVISGFGQHFIKTKIFPKDMSDHLRNAMDKRCEGDYEYTTSINKDEANNLLKIGQEFIKKMIQYLEEHKHL
jgi:uncharacterized protein (UPF0332 family)